MKVSILTVGKTRSKEILGLIADLSKRIKKFKLDFIEVKAHGDDILKEQSEISQKLKDLGGNKQIFIMSEWGTEETSLGFSKTIQKSYEGSQDIIFIIGGASGFTKEFRTNFKNQFSLSKMTFPHEYAKLMLVEQVYRAQAIMDGHPYSK